MMDSPDVTRKRLIVHAGLHKTGTTTIQHFLHRNRRQLKKQGILYPFEQESHWQLAAGAGLTRNHPTEPYAGLWDTLRQLSADHPEHDILLSAEDFSLVISMNHPAIVRSFFERLHSLGRPVTVILYFRRQDEWLESLYLEYLKHLWKVDLQRFVEVRRPLLDYNNVLSFWQEHLGPDGKVLPILFEKKQSTDIRLDFLSHLGLRDSGAFVRERSHNHRGTLLQVQLLYGFLDRINRHLMPGSLDRFFFPFHKLRPLVASFLTECESWESTRSYRILPHGTAEKILSDFADSNRTLAEEWFPDSKGRLFSEPLQSYEPAALDWPEGLPTGISAAVDKLWESALAVLDLPYSPFPVTPAKPWFHSVRLDLPSDSFSVQEIPPGFGGLSWVNGRPAAEVNILPAEDEVRLQGWAVVPEGLQLAGAVIAYVNDMPYLAKTRIPRNDVAEHFGKPNLVYAGFLVQLTRAAFDRPVNEFRFVFCGKYQHAFYSTGKRWTLHAPETTKLSRHGS